MLRALWMAAAICLGGCTVPGAQDGIGQRQAVTATAVAAPDAWAQVTRSRWQGASSPARPAADPSDLEELQIHVAPHGNDQWSGRTRTDTGPDGPVATVARAQELARAANRRNANSRVAVRVVLAPGTYRLAAPLLFTPADSGTAAAPVIYEAQDPGTVTLSGSQRLAALPALHGDSTVLRYALPAEARASLAGGGQLFVNGQRATLARQPKQGSHWFVTRRVSLPAEPAQEKGHEAFGAGNEAVNWLSGLSPQERERAVVQLMHSWNVSAHRLAEVDTKTGQVRVMPRSKWAFLSSGSSQRWHVENVPSALTEPGEWVSVAAEVRYRPRPAELGQSLEVEMPVLQRLVVLRGDPTYGRWVEHLHFRGLRFAHTRHVTPSTGFVDPQAAIGVGAAIEVDGARHLRFEHCTLTQTAAYGIWFRTGVMDSAVIDSYFHDLGGGAIQVGVASPTPDGVGTTLRNTLHGNRIDGTGHVFPGAVGIWIGQARETTVTHNLVANTSYTGISVGWTWGLGPASSSGHRIENNLLVNIGGGTLSDLGGIYTLGRLPGTLIAGNLIREVRAYPGYGPGPGEGAWGIYNDIGTSGVRVQDNVVIGTDSGGYHLHQGQDNLLRGNLFAGGRQGEVRVTRPHNQLPQATLVDNALLPEGQRFFGGLAASPNLAFQGNWMSAPGHVSQAELARCRPGCQAITAAVHAGARPQDLAFIGLNPDQVARWAAVAEAAGPGQRNLQARADVRVEQTRPAATVAPPLPLEINLRSTALGDQPDGLIYRPAGDRRAIRAVTQPTAPDGRCLLFTDSALLPNAYDPHAFALLNHEEGQSTSAFSILIDSETDFVHEWRDNQTPYRIGPTLRITAAGVFASGRRVAPAVVGQWMQVRVTAPLGSRAGGWSLGVRTGAGDELVTHDLPVGSADWQSLHYAGYISNARKTTALCLAEVSVTHAPTHP